MATLVCVTDDTESCGAHTVRDIDPRDPPNIKFLLAFERTQGAPQSVCLNAVASENMPFISVTRDTPHFEMSILKDAAFQNIWFIVVTRDTSHFEMSALKDAAS